MISSLPLAERIKLLELGEHYTIDKSKELGKGGFGNVYRGDLKMKNGQY